MASINKRTRKNGSEYFTVTWRDPDTKKQRGLSFDTKGEAELFRRSLEVNAKDFELAEAVVYAANEEQRTVTETVEEHIDLLVKPTTQTIHNYRYMLEHHINPHIGSIAIGELSQRHLTAWIRALQAKTTTGTNTMAPKTIRNVHGLLSAAMETAVRLHYRADNPCRGMDLPTTEHHEDKEQFLTWDEWCLIHRNITPRYQPLALFLVMTGARFGEATAVKVADVNYKNVPATVRINKSWKRDPIKGFYIGPPKTASSKRTVAMPPAVVTALEPAMKGVPGTTLLFRTSSGGRIAQKYFWTAWDAALDSARQQDPTFTKTPRIHDLRHTSASWGLQGGLTLYEVARRLGHASTATTERVYAHLMHEGMARGADVMGKMLQGPAAIEDVDDVLEADGADEAS